MNEETLVIDIEVDGRPVKGFKVKSEFGTHFKVQTIQKTTVISPSRQEEDGTFVGGFVVNEGDRIEVEGSTQAEIIEQLKDCDFTEAQAQEITRHLLDPSSFGKDAAN